MPTKDTLCNVIMDGKSYTSDEFVVVMTKEDGDVSIVCHADALTIGKAASLTMNAFVSCLQDCTEEERAEVADILGPVFTFKED